MLFLGMGCLAICAQGQDEEAVAASLNLKLQPKDTLTVCAATLATNEGKPISEVEVRFYIKRSFGLLPIGEAVSTDENGEASVPFPLDIPKDFGGKVTVIAKIEDDEKVGSLDAEVVTTSLGINPKHTDEWNKRSLSASREKVPWMLMFASYSIIAGIWATIIYVAYQLFAIKKLRTKKS
jgi:hypothetical protein